MSFYTDDPIADFARHDAEQQREMDKLPECNECGQPITDECCWEINDELICNACLLVNHRKFTDDFME